MKWILILLIPAIALGAEPRGDLAKLQGTWRLESVQKDGNVLAQPEDPQEMTIEGEMWRAGSPDRAQGVLRLDPSAHPKQLDLTRTDESGDAGRTAPCLYRLKGDRLEICREPVGRGPYRRPSRFSADARSGTLIFRWRRVVSAP